MYPAAPIIAKLSFFAHPRPVPLALAGFDDVQCAARRARPQALRVSTMIFACCGDHRVIYRVMIGRNQHHVEFGDTFRRQLDRAAGRQALHARGSSGSTGICGS